MRKVTLLCLAVAVISVCSCAGTGNRRNLPRDPRYVKGYSPMRALPAQYLCVKTDRKPVIDGVLEKEFWGAVASTGNFWVAGDSTKHGARKTEVKMCWDDENLYVAWLCEDHELVSTITEADGHVYSDDVFEIFISPWNDRYHYYEIDYNVGGTLFDAEVWNFVETGWYPDNKLDKAWAVNNIRCAIKLGGTVNNPNDKDTGYTAEIAIPFTSFAPTRENPPMDGANWRVNFFRGDVKKHREWVGMYEWSRNFWSIPAFHIPRGMGHILFVE